jgi:hypothetical protein
MGDFNPVGLPWQNPGILNVQYTPEEPGFFAWDGHTI